MRDSELAQFSQALEKLKADKEIKDKIKRKSHVIRPLWEQAQRALCSDGYIETLLELPWNKVSKDTIDMDKAGGSSQPRSLWTGEGERKNPGISGSESADQ